MPSRNSIQVVINATDNASKVFDSVAGNIQSVGKAALAFGATAIAGATTAMVGLGIQSVNTFKDFEKGMNEVFTLLPGISGDAMREMEGQVLSFNNAVGRTSQDTIPALYQALSAGVPQDNVFEFLELANKAAVGGVTDLETAVDGITSVINAYGTDVLSATQASDLMFTAVRLGKTTFDEMAASLSNVTPNAAALGVGFQDVTAAIATMTAQGIPTAQVTTMLRAAFSELQDSGSQVSKVFKEVSGVSFKEFIAQGGNTAEAMEMLQKAAKDSGVDINELFSTLEAGGAALALSGGNLETFQNNLEAMANSTGATEAAFNQMNQGIQVALNKLFARWETLLINIGRIIAPILSPIIDIVSGIVEKVGNAFGSLADLLDPSNPNSFFAKLEAGVPLFNAVQATVARFLSSLGVSREVFIPVAKSIGAIVNVVSVFMKELQSGHSVFVAFTKSIKSAFDLLGNPDAGKQFAKVMIQIRDIVNSIIRPIQKWVQENVKLQDVLMALGIAIASVVIPAIIGIVAAFAPVIATFGLLVAGISLLRQAWETNFMGIRDIVANVFDRIRSIFGAFKANLEEGRSIFTSLFAPLSYEIDGLIFNLTGVPRVFSNVVKSVSNTANMIIGKFRLVSDFITGEFADSIKLRGLRGAFESLFREGHLGSVDDLLASLGFSSEISQSIMDFANDSIVKPFFRIVDAISPAFREISTFISNNIEKIFEWGKVLLGIGMKLYSLTSPLGIIKAALELFGVDVIGIFERVAQGITDFFATLNQGGSLSEAINAAFGGGDTVGGFISNIQNMLTPLISFIQLEVIPTFNMIKDSIINMWEQSQPYLQSFGDWFIQDVMPQINGIILSVIGFVGALATTLVELWTIVQPHLASFASWFLETGLPAIGDFITGTFLPAIQTIIDTLTTIWTDISPHLTDLANWFLVDVLPPIIALINDVFLPAIQSIIDIFVGIWDTISPPLTDLYNWFMSTGLSAIIAFLKDTVETRIQSFIDKITGIWTSIQPHMETLKAGIMGVLDTIIGGIQKAIDTFNSLTSAVSGGVGGFQTAGQATQQIGSGLSSGQYSVGDVFGAVGHAFGIGGRQFGGQVTAGKPYIVGEKRPEVFMPKSSGNIFPSLGALAGGIMSIAGKQARPSAPSPSQAVSASGGQSRGENISGRPIQITIINKGQLSDEDANQNVYKLKRELQVQGFNVSGN